MFVVETTTENKILNFISMGKVGRVFAKKASDKLFNVTIEAVLVKQNYTRGSGKWMLICQEKILSWGATPYEALKNLDYGDANIRYKTKNKRRRKK